MWKDDMAVLGWITGVVNKQSPKLLHPTIYADWFVYILEVLKKVSQMLEVSEKELGSAFVADYTMTRGK